MKNILIVLFFLIVITLGVGFYLKSSDPATGDLLIGLSMVSGFFILMPLFIYHRWKNKKVSDYMLNKENIMKMREYQQNQEKNRRK